VVGVWILAGLLMALPVAGLLAGKYLLLAAGIAVVPAAVAIKAREPAPYAGARVVWVLRPLMLLSLVAVYASVFGAYVLPEHQTLAAAGMVVVVAAVYRFIRIPRSLVWVAAFGILGASAWYHRDSPPELVRAPSFLHLDGGISWWRVALAALVLFAVLVPLPPDQSVGGRAVRRFVTGVILGGLLTFAALRWLGTDLSLTFTRELVADSHLPALATAAVVIGSVGIFTPVVASDLYGEAMLAVGDWFGVVAAGALVFAGPLIVMLVAGVLMATYAVARFVVEADGGSIQPRGW
jgi:hypothetical protein